LFPWFDFSQVAIGTDPPKEVPKEEFERLEEKLEELKQEAAADLADDGSVDSELEERIKELQETLTDVVPCVEINQCVGCTKSFLGDDASVLAPSSGEEPTPPRHRAGVASLAWRSTRRFRTNAP